MTDIDLRMLFQIVGAVICVVNYLLIQSKRISATEPLSLSLVGIGGSIMLTSAFIGHDFGLILLETVWLIITSVTLSMRAKTRLTAVRAARTGTGDSLEPLELIAPELVLDQTMSVSAPVDIVDQPTEELPAVPDDGYGRPAIGRHPVLAAS